MSNRVIENSHRIGHGICISRSDFFLQHGGFRPTAGTRPKMVRSAAQLMTLLATLLVAACSDAADVRGDFASASDLCIAALSGTDHVAVITAAGWSNEETASSANSSSAASDQQFSKGPLSLVLTGTERDRCYVEGLPSKVGSLEEVKDVLSVKLGKAIEETRASFRWRAKTQGLLVKLSQTNTDRGEVLRLYVFRPNRNLIEGVGS